MRSCLNFHRFHQSNWGFGGSFHRVCLLAFTWNRSSDSKLDRKWSFRLSDGATYVWFSSTYEMFDRVKRCKRCVPHCMPQRVRRKVKDQTPHKEIVSIEGVHEYCVQEDLYGFMPVREPANLTANPHTSCSIFSWKSTRRECVIFRYKKK